MRKTFIEQAKEIYKNKYKYEKYADNRKIKVICPIHGESIQFKASHLKGHGCRKCAVESQKTTKEDFIKKAIKFHNNKYNYSKIDYVNNNTAIVIICPIHGEFKQKPCVHLRGNGCRKCAYDYNYRLLLKSQEDFIKECSKVHNNKYDYSLVQYKGAKKKIIIICPEHGKFEQEAGSHLSGCGCLKCGYKSVSVKQSGNINNFINKSNKIHNNKFDYSKVDYTKMCNKVTIICPEHGEFTQIANNHIRGWSCPKCSVTGPSKVEYKLFNELSKYSLDWIQSDRNVLEGYELDIYNKKFSIAVEVNGMYWHSNKFKDKNHLLNKTLLCKNKGIQLLHFWDYEVENKLDSVVSLINSKLCLNSNKIYYARKIECKQIDNSLAKVFINKYHLQGYTNCNYSYGLFFGSDLLGVVTLRKSWLNNKFNWEIARVIFKPNYIIVGGFEKVLKYIKNIHSGSLITFADYRYSQGKVYSKAGFKFLRLSSPNYLWVKSNYIFSRYQTMKNKLHKILKDNFNSNLSESENMINNGFYKLYDCGNLVFSYNLNT